MKCNVMATAQEVRKKTCITKPVNATASKTCMKELVALALSSIAYQRALLPENAFADLIFAGVPCKIINHNTKCQEAKSLVQWINGAFEAFDKGYLREMILCLEPASSEHGEIIEAYKFTFNHEDDEIIFGSQDSNGKCSNVEITNIPDFSELLKSIKNVPEPEPLNVYENLKMYMRLLYYDDVTPPDYEPQGYQKVDNSLTFKYATDHLSFSNVRTNWHSLKIRTKILKSSCALKTVDNINQNTLRKERSTNSQPSASKEEIGIPPSEVINKSSARPNQMGSETALEVQNPNLSCACGFNRESSEIIMKCSSCIFWQHGACYGLIGDEVAPQEFYCFLCSIDKPENICFDPVLTNLNDNDRKSLCMYRRVLAYCERNSRIKYTSMANDLNIPETLLNKIIDNLEEDKVMLMNRRGSSLVRIVDYDNLKSHVIPKYFSKTSSCIPKLF